MAAGVDSSASALALADSNAQLNGWQQPQYTFLKNDIVKYMQQQIVEGTQWDLVVLDPPKLAPNRKSLNRAMAKYRKLNTLVRFLLSIQCYTASHNNNNNSNNNNNNNNKMLSSSMS